MEAKCQIIIPENIFKSLTQEILYEKIPGTCHFSFFFISLRHKKIRIASCWEVTWSIH